MHIVITDFDTFVKICTHPAKYTNIRFKHEVEFSWVKIVMKLTLNFKSEISRAIRRGNRFCLGINCSYNDNRKSNSKA